jgi:hypothetical protein
VDFIASQFISWSRNQYREREKSICYAVSVFILAVNANSADALKNALSIHKK